MVLALYPPREYNATLATWGRGNLSSSALAILRTWSACWLPAREYHDTRNRVYKVGGTQHQGVSPGGARPGPPCTRAPSPAGRLRRDEEGSPERKSPEERLGGTAPPPPGGPAAGEDGPKAASRDPANADPLLLVSRGLGLSLLQLLERTQIGRSIEANSSALPLKGSSTRLWGTNHLRPRAGGGGPA